MPYMSWWFTEGWVLPKDSITGGGIFVGLSRKVSSTQTLEGLEWQAEKTGLTWVNNVSGMCLVQTEANLRMLSG